MFMLSVCILISLCHQLVTANGSRLYEVANFQHKCSFEKLNLPLAQNCHRSTSAAILQNRCKRIALLFSRVCSLSFRVCLGAVAWWIFCKTWLMRWTCMVLQMFHQKRWFMLVCNLFFLLIQLQFVKRLRQYQSLFQRLKLVHLQVVTVYKLYHLTT